MIHSASFLATGSEITASAWVAWQALPELRSRYFWRPGLAQAWYFWPRSWGRDSWERKSWEEGSWEQESWARGCGRSAAAWAWELFAWPRRPPPPMPTIPPPAPASPARWCPKRSVAMWVGGRIASRRSFAANQSSAEALALFN